MTGRDYRDEQSELWRVGEVFGDPVIATAILDQLLNHSITINIKGESYWLREKLKASLIKPKFPDETGPEKKPAS